MKSISQWGRTIIPFLIVAGLVKGSQSWAFGKVPRFEPCSAPQTPAGRGLGRLGRFSLPLKENRRGSRKKTLWTKGIKKIHGEEPVAPFQKARFGHFSEYRWH